MYCRCDIEHEASSIAGGRPLEEGVHALTSLDMGPPVDEVDEEVDNVKQDQTCCNEENQHQADYVLDGVALLHGMVQERVGHDDLLREWWDVRVHLQDFFSNP